jgi:hypothetical protein
MMPKKVKATTSGFINGQRKRAGQVFVIDDSVKVGKWMEVLKVVTPEQAAEASDKAATVKPSTKPSVK